MTEATLKLFSVFHKSYAVPPSDFITPIQVGDPDRRQDLGFLHDAEGENLAHKNATHCELTAMYWIWKHLEDLQTDYVGLCHYRRYFTTDPDATSHQEFYATPCNDTDLKKVGSPELRQHLLSQLQDADILVARAKPLMLRSVIPISIREQYLFCHIPEDWNAMQTVISRLHPSLSQEMQTFFGLSQKMHCYNMFVCSNAVFSAYCSWLFPILEALEAQIKISAYPYQQRVFGFLSERLFNFYLHHKKLKVSELPVLFFTD